MSDPPATPEEALPAQAGTRESVLSGHVTQVAVVARTNISALVLVIARITSAVAATIGLQKWVPLIAAITTIVSGANVLRSSLIVPTRVRTAENATVLMFVDKTPHGGRLGNCLQIGPYHWVTAAHIVQNREEGPYAARVLIGDQWRAAKVIYCDNETDLAVLTTSVRGPGAAKIARSLPDPGDKIELVGWNMGESPRIKESIRATMACRLTSLAPLGAEVRFCPACRYGSGRPPR